MSRSYYKPHNVRRGDPLTTRELQILALAAAGESTPAISRRLAIAENTVKTHLTSVYRKADCRNRVQAARHYFDHYAVPVNERASEEHGPSSLIRQQVRGLQTRLDDLKPSVAEAERLRATLRALRAIELD
jgi:DNA-binding CsgD family transcriptional regulator